MRLATRVRTYSRGSIFRCSQVGTSNGSPFRGCSRNVRVPRTCWGWKFCFHRQTPWCNFQLLLKNQCKCYEIEILHYWRRIFLKSIFNSRISTRIWNRRAVEFNFKTFSELSVRNMFNVFWNGTDVFLSFFRCPLKRGFKRKINDKTEDLWVSHGFSVGSTRVPC